MITIDYIGGRGLIDYVILEQPLTAFEWYLVSLNLIKVVQQTAY